MGAREYLDSCMVLHDEDNDGGEEDDKEIFWYERPYRLRNGQKTGVGKVKKKKKRKKESKMMQVKDKNNKTSRN